MEITDTAIEEFTILWEETYAEKITKDQAQEYAGQLLNLLRVIYGPC